MTDQVSELAHSAGSPGKRPGDPWQQVGKGLTLASSVAASPSIHLDVERDGYSLDRQILQAPHISAMARGSIGPHSPDIVRNPAPQRSLSRSRSGSQLPRPECRVQASIASCFPWIINGNASPECQTGTCTQIEEEPPPFNIGISGRMIPDFAAISGIWRALARIVPRHRTRREPAAQRSSSG
jgi:hypothetical protein